MDIRTMNSMDITELITDHSTRVNKLDLNEWSGVVSCSGLHDSDDDDDSTIDTASSTSVGTDTDTKLETESMKTGDGLKLIEVDDGLDDDKSDKSDKSSVYDADIFDQISNCDIGVINDYDKYDDCRDSSEIEKAGRIPDYIFLLTGEHKQDHEYTIELEFEEEEIDYQNMTKNGSNTNADDQTDACTMATKMLDAASTSYDDNDELSFACDDDSEYDDFDFGDDDEEEDISIINDEEEHDSIIIQVQELTSITSSTDEVEDNNDDDNDSCISMIDNLMDQFKLLNFASMTESSSSSVYTTDDHEVEVEANVDADNDDDDHDDTDTDTDNDCLSKIDNLMEQFEFDFNELQSDMSIKFGTNNTKEFFSSLPTSTTTTTTSESIISSALITAATITPTACDETPKTTKMIEITKEDDVYIDTNPIEYDLDKEQHTTIKCQDHHHSWHQQQRNHRPCNRIEAITCEENPMMTTIVTEDDEDDVDIYADIDSISSYGNNDDSEQHHTMIEFHDDDHWEQQQQQQQQQQHHPCKRTETREECEGGALPLSLPSRQPMLRMLLRSKSEPLLCRIKEDEQVTIVLSKKQQHILDIVNDMKVIHHTHQIEQAPIKFNRQQYISIGQ